ncbi:TraR/DksA family transcriptional regulator [Flavobacteriaceae bacterium 14752]|uniref:TraR/DksA family transcriptional regulator n=1 Tax=Mesohalobacter salilacus TaxID=2491711 RepID=UPI000F633E15|nr:TraR/DksA family transcriptional regulator [Flavobacteriaceae bacterium 14752]
MDKEAIKNQLDKEIERLQKQIKNYKALTKPIAPENAIGRVSRIDAINNKSVLKNALRKAEQRYNGMLKVYDRIDDEDFGQCAKCHDKIPLQRLMIMPESRFCVKCAENRF